MSLPPFAPPTIAELREWYRRYRQNENVWRLILEVQHARDTFARLEKLLGRVQRAANRAEFGRLTGEAAPLQDACETVAMEVIRAAGPLKAPGSKSSTSGSGAEDLGLYPEEKRDLEIEKAAQLIARGHQRRR